MRPSLAAFFSGVILAWAVPANCQTNSGYQIFVSNEKSEDLTVLRGGRPDLRYVLEHAVCESNGGNFPSSRPEKMAGRQKSPAPLQSRSVDKIAWFDT